MLKEWNLCCSSDSNSFEHKLFLNKKRGLLFMGFEVSESACICEITKPLIEPRRTVQGIGGLRSGFAIKRIQNINY